VSKTLRIVIKDARHLWPEILLYLGILLAFTVTEPLTWPASHGSLSRPLLGLPSLLRILVPLGWCLLISRAVHDESLVGDQQFWITRPYGWRRLLAAKIIFVIAFVMVPLLFAKMWLLHQAGISPFANIATLLASLLATALIFFLPVFAVATVTANLVRIFFTGVACILFLALVGSLDLLVPQNRIFGPDVTPIWLVPLLCGTCVGVVVLQYARRRALIARIALVALGIVLSLSIFFNLRTWTVHRAYKDIATNKPFPLMVALDTAPALLQTSPKDVSIADDPGYGGMMTLPLVIENPVQNHAFRIDNVVVSYVDPISRRRVLDEQGGGSTYLPGKVSDGIHLTLGPEAYALLKDTPIVFTLTLAVTELEATNSSSSTIALHNFSVTGGGVCHPPDLMNAREEQAQFALGSCQFPIHSLPLTYVTARWSDQACGQPSTSGIEGVGWISGADAPKVLLDLDPVENVSVFLSERTRPYGNGYMPRSLCPGTQVNFVNYRDVRHRLIHVVLPSVLPSHYTRGRAGTLGYQ
jgi:hypothetical protein